MFEVAEFWRKLRFLARRAEFDRDLDEEMRLHLDLRAAQHTEEGLDAASASRAARLNFGNRTQWKETSREMWSFGKAIDQFVQDFRYGLRILAKSKGFTLAAALTLALGIGASTAVFSVVNAILLKPLPYPDAGRIVIPWRLAPAGLNLGYNEIPWGLREFWFLQRESKTFQKVGAFQSDSFSLTGSGEPALLAGLRASAGFFPALGVSAAQGRTFTVAEDRPGREHEVILGDQLWRDRFGADPAVIGRAIELSGSAYTVVGVMPAGFVFPRAEEMPGSLDFPREAQLWVPLALPAVRRHAEDPDELAFIARLKPGVTIDQAQAEMNIFTSRLEAPSPRYKGWFHMRVTPLARQVAGDTRRPLLLILGAVGIVLLIACSNVASLLLMRSLARAREFTLRAALGAGSARLLRQLFTENLMLAAAGGVAGMLLALLGIHFVRTLGPASIPRLREIALDLPVCAFAIGVTVVTGIIFGLAPALAATRSNLADALKSGGHRSAGSDTSPKLRNALLVSEVALALVLTIAAGLLVRTFYGLLSVDAGFHPERVLTFQLSLPSSQYSDPDRLVGLYQRVLGRLQSLPGVQSAAIAEVVPLGGAGESTGVRIPGHPVVSARESPIANYTIVSPQYFAAVGTTVVRGRDFQERDTAATLPVTVINRAMARKYWPGEDPIGKQVGPASPRFPLTTIVGIASDIKHLSLRDDPVPEMYVLYNQKPWPSMLTMQAVLRTKSDPAAMTAIVRETVHSVNSGLPVEKLTTLSTLVDNAMTQPRFSMLVLGSFGALAIVLACIGMYGVVSYSAAQRTREIGIRMALGAERRTVFAMVVGQGARLAGLGIAIGLAAALGVTRAMTRFLYGVHPTDPQTFAAVSLLLVAVALLACYLPAWRATRVDPMIALRHE
jgi:putative ABC transport system permease protein